MKNENSQKNYYVGLDIGTNSLGYAVCDEEYGLLKHKGEPMWGTHLFDEAKLNNERRAFRSARRRLDRRQQRVEFVRELFAPEIAKKDENFYKRLIASNRQEQKFVLFADKKENKEFYKRYPTIHHLVTDLIYGEGERDVRLVYMACAYLVAHRGHFLNEVNKDNLSSVTDFGAVYSMFVDFMREKADTYSWCSYVEQLKTILSAKIGITTKFNKIKSEVFGGKIEKGVSDNHPYSVEDIVKLLCGGKVELKKLFGVDAYSNLDTKSISLSDDDVVFASIFDEIEEEEQELIRLLKNVFDCALLSSILMGKDTISEAKVEIYNQHKEDLRTLKYFVKKYASESYAKVFVDKNVQDNYVSYIYNDCNVKRAKREDFIKFIKKIVLSIEPETTDSEQYADMRAKIEADNFMPKQVNGDNRVIPYQLYWYELKKILEKASTYLTFLNDIDNDGISTKDKVLSIIEFRVPYFVGPLNSHSKFAWIQKKSNQKIYPWNFKEVVDLDASEQEFIRRMTNVCTYLQGEYVVPKNSLLYSAYEVLNEINNIKINEVPISVECKQKIYTELFENYQKVTQKRLEDFLVSNNYMKKGDKISGIDDSIKSSLKSQLQFKRLLLSNQLSLRDVENIIQKATYSEDNARYKEWLFANYPHLSKEDITYVSRQKFKDFGRLSKALLNGIEGFDTYEGTGEVRTVMYYLWNTNLNLMQIIDNKRFTFKAQIEQIKKDYYSEHNLSLSEKLDEKYLSNAVKRPVIRTLDVLKDIVKVNGCVPKRIFIEMTRGEGEGRLKKGQRSKSRYEQIKELYNTIDTEDVRRLNQELDALGVEKDNKLQSEVYFLYFTQMGRCMYTGEELRIDKLKDGTYNVDHIYPQSVIKDDSIINNKVLVTSIANKDKGDKYPIDFAVQAKMKGFWDVLFKNKLISEEKYKRLTRTIGFSEQELEGFIARQLVETSQSTKAVAEIIKEIYPDTEVVYVKAGLVSEFRNEMLKVTKCREVNDLHHAKDAYLNIAVGNAYYSKFTKKWFIKREKDAENDGTNLTAKSVFKNWIYDGDTPIWKGYVHVDKVRKTISKNNIHITMYPICAKGGFFDQNPLRKADGLIPLKQDMDTTLYGGYNKASVSFYVLVKYTVGKKSDVMFAPIKLLDVARYQKDDESKKQVIKESVEDILGKQVNSVDGLLNGRPIKVGTILSLDGYRVIISGKSGSNLLLKSFTPLKLDVEKEKYIKALNRFLEKQKLNNNIVFDETYDHISSEKNCQLYDIYVEKLSNYPFNKRPNTPIDVITQGRQKFAELTLIDQVKCLQQIQILFSRGGTVNLESVGGKGIMGLNRISINASNWKKKYQDCRIIDVSASGLFEKASDNLLDYLK